MVNTANNQVPWTQNTLQKRKSQSNFLIPKSLNVNN